MWVRVLRSGLVGFLLLCPLVFTHCTKKDTTPTVWIYTSIYKNVIADLEPQLKAKFPGIKFEWFQSGSENVAARLNAELSTGKTQADLVMTSDPLWYLELKQAGFLLPYESVAAKRVPEAFRDPEHAFVTVRMPVAVIAHQESTTTPPKSWTELTDPKWKGKISMGSPMESGTAMLITSQLARKNGWPYFEKLRANDLLSAGGNSAVVSRMETKERPVGMLLLENVLEAKKKGSPLGIVYPKDGVVLVPSPIAILKTTKSPELVKQVYDYFLTDDMQKAIVRGRMYSPIAELAPPEGAIAFSDILKNSLEWSPKILGELYAERENTKRRFRDTVLQ